METYIATFFSHFGRCALAGSCGRRGIDCALMPVPRQISSSCGTCVRFTAKPLRLCQPKEIGSACSVRRETVTWSFNLIYK